MASVMGAVAAVGVAGGWAAEPACGVAAVAASGSTGRWCEQYFAPSRSGWACSCSEELVTVQRAPDRVSPAQRTRW